MNLEIKDYFATDLPVPVDHWRPEDSQDVYFLLELTIGAKGSKGGSDYQCIIATPRGLERISNQNENLIIETRAIFIVKKYNWKMIKSEIEKIIEKCEDRDPVNTQWKLQRYFLWEYEDYKVVSF